MQDELYVVSKMSVSRFNPVTKKWTLVCEGGRWIYLIQIFITSDLEKKIEMPPKSARFTTDGFTQR